MNEVKNRCEWCGATPLYIAYHDNEWGVPVYDDDKLFEFLILETFQAGLSWITILKRREGYREAYEGFVPETMAKWSDAKLQELLQDTRIIRNRLKVQAARTNAQAFLKLQEEQPFSEFLWSFVDGKPIVNAWKTMQEVPVSTPQSDAMSKALKKRGFKFVGSTIIYAHMQATGMVNDHLTSCYRYEECAALA